MPSFLHSVEISLGTSAHFACDMFFWFFLVRDVGFERYEKGFCKFSYMQNPVKWFSSCKGSGVLLCALVWELDSKSDFPFCIFY